MSDEEYGVCPTTNAIDMSKIARSTLFADEMDYPRQIQKQPTPGLVGELRGAYANHKWKPQWSTFAHPRLKIDSKVHKGVDIYAPLGTHIYATFDGQLVFRNDQDLGLFAELRFVYAGESWLIRYGHLDTAVGGPRSVKQGEFIGTAGCSGNAAGAQPCFQPNRCGMHSTHVHVAMLSANKALFVDPLKALKWKLAYETDLQERDCEEA